MFGSQLLFGVVMKSKMKEIILIPITGVCPEGGPVFYPNYPDIMSNNFS